MKTEQLGVIPSTYNFLNFWRDPLLHLGKWKNISTTFYVINNIAYPHMLHG